MISVAILYPIGEAGLASLNIHNAIHLVYMELMHAAAQFPAGITTNVICILCVVILKVEHTRNLNHIATRRVTRGAQMGKGCSDGRGVTWAMGSPHIILAQTFNETAEQCWNAVKAILPHCNDERTK